MIKLNKPILRTAVSKMKNFCKALDAELAEQEIAERQAPNAPAQDQQAQLDRITVGEYLHIDSEIRRIYAANSNTSYVDYDPEA